MGKPGPVAPHALLQPAARSPQGCGPTASARFRAWSALTESARHSQSWSGTVRLKATGRHGGGRAEGQKAQAHLRPCPQARGLLMPPPGHPALDLSTCASDSLSTKLDASPGPRRPHPCSSLPRWHHAFLTRAQSPPAFRKGAGAWTPTPQRLSSLREGPVGVPDLVRSAPHLQPGTRLMRAFAAGRSKEQKSALGPSSSPSCPFSSRPAQRDQSQGLREAEARPFVHPLAPPGLDVQWPGHGALAARASLGRSYLSCSAGGTGAHTTPKHMQTCRHTRTCATARPRVHIKVKPSCVSWPGVKGPDSGKTLR